MVTLKSKELYFFSDDIRDKLKSHKAKTPSEVEAYSKRRAMEGFD